MKDLQYFLLRMHELKKKGVKALSEYDVKIAHAGNTAKALYTAKDLIRHQINWTKQRFGI